MDSVLMAKDGVGGSIANGTACDHLFVSYASEDYELAEWLTFKLTSEGYHVWCDKVKLLGGESYPRDIDRAIKERTFRLLALLSRSSIDKPNPVKERTLALNIGKDRQIDFLIPLNIDGLSSTELDWMTSDLTFIPFRDWAQGLGQLLKKLQSINAPRTMSDGRGIVRLALENHDSLVESPETVWTNLIPIQELPRAFVRAKFPTKPPAIPGNWPHYQEDATTYWFFELPPGIRESSISLDEVDINATYVARVPTHNILASLLRQSLQRYCCERGLKVDHWTGDLYFPQGLLGQDRLKFRRYDGRSTWVKAVGERTFRTGPGQADKSRYHLAIVFRPMTRAYAMPVIQIQLRVHLQDLSGAPLEHAKALRRRKKICKNWWNYEWLSRLTGVVTWLADGKDSVDIVSGQTGKFVIAGLPIRLSVPLGINEGALVSVESADDYHTLDDEPEIDRSESE